MMSCIIMRTYICICSQIRSPRIKHGSEINWRCTDYNLKVATEIHFIIFIHFTQLHVYVCKGGLLKA